MTNVTGLKKIISVALLGSLLVTGAVVYADTATADTAVKALKAGIHMQEAPNGNPEAAMLSRMVTEGVISQEEQTVIEKAMETQRTQMMAARDAQDSSAVKPEIPAKPEAGTKPVSHYGRLAEVGLISQTLADKIDAYITAQRDAAFAEQVKPLVDNGTFGNTAAVRTAMDAVRDEMKTQMDAGKPSDDAVKGDAQKMRPDFKTMTEAEKTALKTEMEAKRTEMEAQHEAAITKVYSDLVAKGTLSQAQADALKGLKGFETGPMGGGRGHGHGPGEMGMGPMTSADTTATTAQ